MNIIITGMMGVGKTTISKKLAQKLKLEFIDLDEEIEKTHHMEIPQIFARYGEKYFRKLEREACNKIVKSKNQIIATGGKALLDKKNLKTLSTYGIVITLLCSPDEILKRIQNENGQRPLLAASNLRENLLKIHRERKSLYLNLPNKIDTTHMSVNEVVDEIVTIIKNKENKLEIVVGEKKSSIYIKNGITKNISPYLKSICKQGDKVFIVSDKRIFSLYGKALINGLKDAQLKFSTFLIPPGERYKNLDYANKIYRWLLNEKADRSSLLISFGGGVISDLSGYVASTFHRGLEFAIIPTTLLAQIDASIGGKNATNLKEAKNQVGTFYFPHLVLIDPLLLISLDARLMKEGLIEALKAGIIGDQKLFQLIKNNLKGLLLKDLKVLEELIIRALRVKIAIVNQDPYEKNKRKLLNLGHTFGHALESYFNYRKLTHGQAVGLGMICASKLALLLNISSDNLLSEVKNVLQRMKIRAPLKNLDIAKIISFMEHDKKRKEGKISFIIPKRIGEVLIIENVSKQIVFKSLKEIFYE